MIATLFAWFIELFIFFSIGDLIIQLLTKRKSLYPYYPFVSTCFTGLCIVGTFICAASIFVPANGILAIVLFSSSLLYWIIYLKRLKKIVQYYKPKVRNLRYWEIALLLIIGYIVLYYAIQPPHTYDSGLYHLQTVMWNEGFRAVPGLANLNGCFGYNVNYLILCSVFNFRQIFNQPIFAIHSLCLLLLFGRLIIGTCKAKSVLTFVIMLLFGFLFFYLYKKDISSPSTDLLPNILIAFLLFEILFDNNSIKKYPLLFLILPIYCLTLKLSAAPICLFPLLIFIYLLKKKKYKPFWKAITLCLAILLPWLIRNVILSGYLIYPFPTIDIFNFDWKAPLSIIQSSKDWAYSWSRIPRVSASTVLQMPFSKWFPIWFSNQGVIKKIVFIAWSVSPIFISILFLKKKKLSIDFAPFFAWIIAFLGTVFWLVTAPDFRFSYSFILLSFLLPLFLFASKDIVFWKKKHFIYSVVNILLLALMVVFTFFKYKPQRELLKKPASVKTVRNVEDMSFTTRKLGNVLIYEPVDTDQCFDQKLPCTPYFKENLRLRGTTLQHGFRMEKESKD